MMEKKLGTSRRGEISWFTPPGIGAGVGYGYAAVETIKALQRKNVNVPFQSDQLDMNKSTSAKCHVSFVQPTFYQGLPDQFRIGYTPWESSQIPDEWITKMRVMDEIWTPATWVADIYKEYEVNEVIRYVPHGFDPEVWKITQRYQKDTFTFLHIGGPTERKGGQRVVDAFLDLFEGDDNMRLVMKSHGPSEARVTYSGVFGNARMHPQITVYEDLLDTEDLAKLYADADCLVYPTNGEGFGLIPFQGLVTGIPTIVTDATACADFAVYGFPLKATPTPGDGIHLGDWYEPDPNHLRELMLYVCNNFDAAKEHAIRGAVVLQNTFTWDHIAEMIIDILGDKIYERI
jgi:glycosyltransferase involved in cell wall biosynthesis